MQVCEEEIGRNCRIRKEYGELYFARDIVYGLYEQIINGTINEHLSKIEYVLDLYCAYNID